MGHLARSDDGAWQWRKWWTVAMEFHVEASTCGVGVVASTDRDGRKGTRGFYGVSVLFGVCILQ